MTEISVIPLWWPLLFQIKWCFCVVSGIDCTSSPTYRPLKDLVLDDTSSNKFADDSHTSIVCSSFNQSRPIRIQIADMFLMLLPFSSLVPPPAAALVLASLQLCDSFVRSLPGGAPVTSVVYTGGPPLSDHSFVATPSTLQHAHPQLRAHDWHFRYEQNTTATKCR